MTLNPLQVDAPVGTQFQLLTLEGDAQPAQAAAASGGGPLPAVNRVVWVMAGGNDTTGDGSYSNPFLTVGRACQLVTALGNASTTLRYVVMVGAGRFNGESVVLPSWTYVVGLSKEATRIAFTSLTLGPSWTPNVDQRGGFQNMTVSGAPTLDFNAVASNQGKLRFDDVVFNDRWTYSAFSAINQVFFDNCFGFDGYNQIGINSISQGCAWLGGPVQMTSVNDGRNLPTLAAFIGGALDGGLTATWTASGGSNAVTATLEGAGSAGPLTLNGAQASVAPASTPIFFPGGVTLTGGATDPRRNLTGSRAGNAALATVCTQLAATGGFTDNTTA
jgi:hypothetical protein